MEENSMNLKRVLFSAALLAIVASSAYAGGLGYNVGTLDLGLVAAPTSTENQTNTSGIIQVTPSYDGIRQYIKSAFDGGKWDGLGLTSSVATAHKNDIAPGIGLYALAPMTGADYKALPGAGHDSFYGVDLTVAGGDAYTLVKFTYPGDVNLDGKITGADLGVVLGWVDTQNNNGVPLTNVQWGQGDLNYDAKLTGADLGTMLSVIDYQNGLPVPLPALAGGGIAPVPEPSTIVLGFLAVTCLLGFRKLWN
jgi:hypothetical protein